jgi:hypothetical protein
MLIDSPEQKLRGAPDAQHLPRKRVRVAHLRHGFSAKTRAVARYYAVLFLSQLQIASQGQDGQTCVIFVGVLAVRSTVSASNTFSVC